MTPINFKSRPAYALSLEERAALIRAKLITLPKPPEPLSPLKELRAQRLRDWHKRRKLGLA